MNKNKFLITFLAVFMMHMNGFSQATWQASWVYDTVSLLPGVNQDVFYSMGNGISRQENNKNWHLAFSMSPVIDSAAIWANHQSSNNFTKVFNIHKDKTQFATVGLADTSAATLQFNNDRGYFDGAFNSIASSNPFNFGWGTYDMTSHNVYGDSVFIVRAGGTYYKLLIDSLNGFTSTYYFTVENISTASAPTSYVISKQPNYANRLFAYFNLGTGVDTNREPVNTSWDLWFGRYTTNSPGSGQGTNNNVVGVFLNKGVKCAKAAAVHVDTAYDYHTTYTVDSSLVSIGWNWKVFDLANSVYVCPDSVSYFITDKNAALWQIQFLAYGGSPTGKIEFQKRPVWPAAVANLPQQINQLAVVPNPVQNQMNVVIDSKEHMSATIYLNDMMGRHVIELPVTLNNGLNAYQLPVASLPSGQYMLQVNGVNWSMQYQVMITN